MKTKFVYTLFSIIIFIGFSSCRTDKKVKNEKVIAYVDKQPIFYNEIDNKVSQELFDELNRIYLIRKIALDEAINDKLLDIESKKFNITKDSLLNQLYKIKINDSIIEKYIEVSRFNGKIPELGKNLLFHDLKSEKGKELLMKNLKQYILNQFIDSLKNISKIEVYIKPPVPPVVNLNDLLIHYKGNLNSKITFLVISDFDCDMCRENKNIYEKVFSKYKDKIRFGYTHFGSYVSISALASECAANQGMFWEMHDSIYNLRNIPDTIDLFRIAGNLNMDMQSFKEDFHSKDLYKKIEDNLHSVELAGIYGTPTILINDKLIFNSSSLEEIEKIIDNE